jgi:hypothetical protein
MKNMIQKRLARGVAIFAVLYLTAGISSGQEAGQAKDANQAAVQQTENKVSVENPENLADQNQKTTVQKEPSDINMQKKEVKKVQSSNPNLYRKAGARPPSISRPAGSGMPKGTGKPAGVPRPGRR